MKIITQIKLNKKFIYIELLCYQYELYELTSNWIIMFSENDQQDHIEKVPTGLFLIGKEYAREEKWSGQETRRNGSNSLANHKGTGAWHCAIASFCSSAWLIFFRVSSKLWAMNWRLPGLCHTYISKKNCPKFNEASENATFDYSSDKYSTARNSRKYWFSGIFDRNLSQLRERKYQNFIFFNLILIGDLICGN